jgi:hypothetical protein
MRLRAQRLHPGSASGDAAEVARALCGVNAQLKPAMMLSLRARLRGAKLSDLTDLIYVRRMLLRTWAMRGTMHLLFRDDAGLILPLVGPPAIAKLRRRRHGLDLDDEKLARGLREIRAILEDSGPLTRDELVSRLNEHGVDIERKSQAPYHLIACAGLEGIVALGPDRPGGKQTYVLADLPSGKARPEVEALAELAERYLKGYGPASATDFSAWSGLPAADAKKGWALLKERGLLTDIAVDGRVLASMKPEPIPEGAVVNLLPAFDTLILGYSDRELVVPAKHHKDVYHGGQTVPVVLVNGEAAGVWRYEIKGGRISLEVRPFGALDDGVRDMVEAEAEDVGHFFGLAPIITWKR